jgi:hypothetical protein
MTYRIEFEDEAGDWYIFDSGIRTKREAIKVATKIALRENIPNVVVVNERDDTEVWNAEIDLFGDEEEE